MTDVTTTRLDHIERQAIAGQRPSVTDTLALVAEVRRLRAYGVSDPYRPAVKGSDRPDEEGEAAECRIHHGLPCARCGAVPTGTHSQAVSSEPSNHVHSMPKFEGWDHSGSEAEGLDVDLRFPGEEEAP
jgi:hypothetical protein